MTRLQKLNRRRTIKQNPDGKYYFRYPDLNGNFKLSTHFDEYNEALTAYRKLKNLYDEWILFAN